MSTMLFYPLYNSFEEKSTKIDKKQPKNLFSLGIFTIFLLNLTEFGLK